MTQLETHDELLARTRNHIEQCTCFSEDCNEETNMLRNALRAVVELCATPDEVTIGDKGLFNSGRNSMREEIKQAIEKELG